MSESARDEAGSWREVLTGPLAPRFALILLGVWLNAADTLVAVTVMPSVGRDLGGFAYFSWATAGYVMGALLAGATAGQLATRLGLRLAMCGAGGVYAVGCALSAASPDMFAFLAGRLVQGLGAGWLMGFCYAAIGSLFPARLLARVFGALTTVWGVATLLGPMVGGLFAEAGFWRGAFWSFGGQALVFILIAALLLKNDAPRPERRPLAWGQLALIAGGVVCIGVADMTGGVAATFAMIALGLGLLIVAIRLGRTAVGGLFPRSASDIRHPVGAGYLAFVAQCACSIAFYIYAPATLQAVHGLGPLAAGYLTALGSLSWSIVGLGVAGLRDRWHGPAIRAGGLMILAAVALFVWVVPHGPVAAIAAAAMLMGSGFGISYAFINRRIIAAAPDDDRALASAGVPSARLLGNAAGAGLAGAVANMMGMRHGLSAESALVASPWIFAAVVPLAVVGAWASWRVGSPRLEG
ncbi:MAG: MFS transporter [Phenylobacterium sp.]|uniref:MFS transporter n=1 Tax=Phenylobacterium sp. TaxID=1871053 RepID=UPI002737385A|nr:MFS transporter [Phenylobacterium sp.]MDP3173516.1 MFS transporter [Phenylobacterium sp.]